MKTLSIILRIFVPAYDMVQNIIKYPDLLQKRSFIAEVFYRYIPTTFFFVWLFSLIPYVGPFLYAILMLLGCYAIFRGSPKNRRFNNTLYYFVILNIGFLGLRSFVGHTIFSNSVAESIGWEAGSPFQIELAFYHLGLAIAAIIYIWNRSKDLALGLVVSKSIFLYGAMGVHIYELIVNQNTNLSNIGPWIIYVDLVVPSLLVYLTVMSYREERGG